MTPDLAAIRERHAAATKGVVAADGKKREHYYFSPALMCPGGDGGFRVLCAYNIHFDSQADVEFDSHSREDIAALLALTDHQAERIADLEASETQLIGERDRAEEMADKLAYSIADMDTIGEHSNLNCPWENALEQAELLHAKVAELERRLGEQEPLEDGTVAV